VKPDLLQPARGRLSSARGFSLMEIMIAVVIIGLLAALAIPGLNRVRFRSTTTRYLNDVRQVRDGVERYALENGGFPPNGTASLHPLLRGYVQDKMFDLPTPLGGMWDWDFEQNGIRAAVSVYQYTCTPQQLSDIDQRLDDGGLSSGSFRVADSKAIYVIEP
jgi:prepilin-type N-terminal cleavage/methylation domain-containing protein